MRYFLQLQFLFLFYSTNQSGPAIYPDIPCPEALPDHNFHPDILIRILLYTL